MRPRLYMQNIQYATYNSNRHMITFETRYISGRRLHFNLTNNQFMALDEVITLIEKHQQYGHYPLGQHVWIHYTSNSVKLYHDEDKANRYCFFFETFEKYKAVTHSRLLSLVRLNRWSNGRGERACHNSRRHGEKSSHHKRSLPSTVRFPSQSSAVEQHCRRTRSPLSRSSDNAYMSDAEETCSIFSQRNDSSSRRRLDSSSSTASDGENLHSPKTMQLFSS